MPISLTSQIEKVKSLRARMRVSTRGQFVSRHYDNAQAVLDLAYEWMRKAESPQQAERFVFLNHEELIDWAFGQGALTTDEYRGRDDLLAIFDAANK